MTKEQIKAIKDAYNSNKKEIKRLRKEYERENMEEDLDYEVGYNYALEFVMDTLDIKYKPLEEE